MRRMFVVIVGVAEDMFVECTGWRGRNLTWGEWKNAREIVLQHTYLI